MDITIVYLRKPADFAQQRRIFHRAELVPVALILLEKASGLIARLEETFAIGQNVDMPWVANKQVRLLESVYFTFEGRVPRSISVGDVIETNGCLYVVEPIGFSRLRDEDGLLAPCGKAF